LRRFATVITLGVILLSVFQLPLIWQGERDFGVLDPETLAASGGQKLIALPRSEIESLVQRETDVLRRSPLDSAAHRNLAMLLLLPPTPISSSELVLNLARYSLSNPAVQMAAMGLLLEKQNHEETAYRIDAVLRAHGSLSESLFPLLAQNFSAKKNVKFLAKTLTQNPPWRGGFLVFLAKQPAYDKLCLDLMRELKTTMNPISPAELRGIFSAWIKQHGSFDKSYFVWLDQLSADQLSLVKGIFDGEFSSTANNLYFDWTISSTRNGKSSIVLKPGSGFDRALLVDFVGNKQAFRHVSQHLLLSPGNYVLSFDVMSKNIEAETGLVWRLYCTKGNKVIAESDAIKSPVPWTKKTVQVELKSENCETQILRLETKASGGLNTSISGQIYFDSFEVKSKAAVTP
jgi:hypothetical protein